MKKLFTALLVLTLILCSVSTCFAGTQETRNAEDAVVDGATINIGKILESTNKTTEIFNFSVEPVTVEENATAQDGKISIYTGLGSFTAQISGEDMQANTDEGAADGGFIGSSEVTFNSAYQKPGIYRYKVTETAGSTTGMTYDESEYIVDVYVGYTDAGETLAVEKTVSYLNDDKAPIEFTNTMSEQSLVIEKNVTGNQADYEKSFDFALEITADANLPAGSVLEGIKTLADGTIETINATVGTPCQFTLAHGEKIVFEGLTQKAEYIITETEAAGYTTTVKELNDAEATVGCVYTKNMDAEGDTVTFTNDRTSTTPTGVLVNVLPFVGLIAIGFIVLAIKKRKEEKDC